MIRAVLGGYVCAVVGTVLVGVQAFHNRYTAFSFEAAPVGMIGLVLFGTGIVALVVSAIWWLLSER